MSYILDALRRADAERERERGAVPDLHAHPMADIGAPPLAPQRRSTAPWIAGGILLLLVPLVWWLMADPRPAPEPGPIAAAPSPPRLATPAPAPAPTVSPAPVPADESRERPPAGASPAEVESLPPLQATTRPPPDRAPRAAAPRPAPGTIESRPAPPATASAGGRPPGGGAPAASAAPRVYQVDELPPEIRAEAPRFSFGGSMYSDDPRSRMVIINGQVLRENDVIGPNLKLDQIRPKSAVFEYRGYRYELPY